MKEYLVYNRKTGQKEPEISGNTNGLNFLYKSLAGRAVSPMLTGKFVSRNYGRYVKSRRSVSKIKSFIKHYNIDQSVIRKPLESFASLNDFFIRELTPDARPVDQSPQHLISPADARLSVFDLMQQNALPVKGYWFTLDQFIKDNDLAKDYKQGWCFVYRLAPCDYHRFCYIDSGRQDEVRRIKGVLHSVNPIAMTSVNSLLAKNYRELTIMYTDNFDTVLHFEVGALMVGKVILHKRHAGYFQRGEEKGWFEFGGSTLVQLFKRNVIHPDQDILDESTHGVETLVKLGERVGARNIG